MPSLTSVLRSPALAKNRARAREWAHENLDRPVLSALAVGSAVRRGADAIYCGESSLIHIGYDDVDRRRLGEMFAEEAGLRTAQFYGPAFPPVLYAEMFRLMRPHPRPRLLVIPMTVRTGTHIHVHEHPVFGYPHARASLTAAPRLTSLLTKVRRPKPTQEEYDRFYALTRTSRWSGERLIGDFRRDLKGIDAATADDDRLRVMWDYFHGEFSETSAGLEDWRRLGRIVRELDVPVLSYRSYMPYECGDRLFDGEFTTHADRNFEVIEEAFRDGLGGRGIYVERPSPPDEHFIQPLDGTEHLNELGRRTLVGLLRQAVADAGV